MSSTRVATPADLIDLVGKRLGVSDWHQITQEQVNLFAEATGDHQRIHVDPERAAAGPFGTTIAHGYLTLALAPIFIAETLAVDQLTASLNHGLNKVRFPSPVPVGSRVRGSLSVAAAAQRPAGMEAAFGLVCEVEGSDRPACVAEVVVLYQ
jgi:acyl dehydratase